MTLQTDPEGNEIKQLLRCADFTGKRVLEIGCGDGRLTWKYARRAKSVTAIDLDRDELRVAAYDRPADLASHVLFTRADAVHIPFAKETFDIVLFGWSLCCLEPAGMPAAMQEAHRVLKQGGLLIDLRPVSGRWAVEVASARMTREIGPLLTYEHAVNGETSARRALEHAQAQNWFVREREESFPYFYSWDTPNEMREYIREEWEDLDGLEEEAMQAARGAWAVADADCRVRVRVQMLIGRWRKPKGSG